MATLLRTFCGFPLRRRGRQASLLRILALAGAALVALLCSQASAAAEREFTADLASRIVQGCVIHAKAKGQSHAIAVYDDGGHPVAVLRMDGNPPGVTEFAMQKAVAVAQWQFSPAEMATACAEARVITAGLSVKRRPRT